MHKKYFGTDGIRGEFGSEPLTEDFFIILGAAIAKSLLKSNTSEKRVLFGCDTRESSNKIIDLISTGLSSEKCSLSNAGIISTPAIAFYAKKNNYDLGIVVSASHNLYQDNGIKIFNKDGYKISVEDENYIENYIEKLVNENYQHNNKNYNLVDVSEDAKKKYIESCLETLSLNKKTNNLKLTLDLANGANYEIGKEVFTKAGYQVNCYNNNPNGKNINEKCGSTYLNNLPGQINKDGSMYGISMDGDGDRIIIIDKHNNILDGDDILYTLVVGKIINNENISGVVGTTMTNYALENYLKKKGIKFIRSDVGDKYVLKEMKKNNYELGGETSGHILMLNFSTSGDSIIAALQFLFYSDILTKNNISNVLEKYPQKITNIFFEQDLPENIIDIAIKEALDKFSCSESRLVIRKSGTENCIRIMLEAKEKDVVEKISEQIKKYIEDKLKKLL
tara:strand:- start:1168 stop:2517 length:1350 start_codon:yes stop_codon:yes gene_type:complete